MTTTPTIRLSSEDVQAGRLHPDALLEACSLFRVNGCLLLGNVFTPAYIDDLRAAYVCRYRSLFEDIKTDGALNVGNKRFMITIEVEPPFSDPFLYANPLFLPIIHRLLGEDCVLGSYGSVTALPGAKAQHVHRDGVLFGDPIDAILPCFALTLIIPLVGVNELNGSTRMWNGSHVTTYQNARNLPYQDPVAPQGAAILMDYRLIHAGRANCSDQVRPILYIVYNRPWFKDYANFDTHRSLIINHSEYEKISESQRPLFALADVT